VKSTGRQWRERRASQPYSRKRKDIAGELGLRIEESSTGGGSDGNFTAALGVPTLDGLGAVGEGAHAAHECILTGPDSGSGGLALRVDCRHLIHMFRLVGPSSYIGIPCETSTYTIK
jgi:hypothetical protein